MGIKYLYILTMADDKIQVTLVKDSRADEVNKILIDETRVFLPPQYVPYSMALREYETEFHSNLYVSEPDITIFHRGKTKTFKNQWTKFNIKIDKLRVINKAEYRKILLEDERILETEKIRQKARNELNGMLSEGKIKSYLLRGNINKIEELTQDWWSGLSRNNIDYNSQIWHMIDDDYQSNSEIVLLNKTQIRNIIEEKLTVYASNDQIDLFQRTVIEACTNENKAISRNAYNEYFMLIYNKRLKDSILKLQIKDLPDNIVRPSGRPKKGSTNILTLDELKIYFKN